VFSDNSRSRIAREFFWILEACREHFRVLLKIDPSESIRISHLLVILSIYMLREEGMKEFRKMDIVKNTPLSKSTVYNAVDWLHERGVVTEQFGKYTCLSRTPQFLTKPDELYSRPLTTAPTQETMNENQIRQIVQQMISAEGAKTITREAPPIKDTGRFTQKEDFTSPSMSIDELLEEGKKNEKKGKELEDEFGDMLL